MKKKNKSNSNPKACTRPEAGVPGENVQFLRFICIHRRGHSTNDEYPMHEHMQNGMLEIGSAFAESTQSKSVWVQLLHAQCIDRLTNEIVHAN